MSRPTLAIASCCSPRRDRLWRRRHVAHHPAVDPVRLVRELTERQPVADHPALRNILAPYRARLLGRHR